MKNKYVKKILISIGFLSLFVFIIQTAKAQANYNCIDSIANWNTIKTAKKKTPDYWIDPKFTAAEQEFIKKSLVVAVERIQEKEIWQEVSKTYGFAHPKSDTIFDSGFCNSIDIQRNLLFHQLYYLSVSSQKTGPETFPKIYIYHENIAPTEDDLGWVGYAYYNKVKIFWDSQKNNWEREGDFQLYLNRYYLNADGIYKNENYWAGTIVHEMLHNLGHQHPDISDAKYNQFQINVLANIIRNFGFAATAGDMKFPTHTCRSKSTGEGTASGTE